MDENFSEPRIGVARNAARKLLKDAKINSYPVLLKSIARKISELHIDGQELEDGISGLQASYKGQSFIRYNIRHSSKRNRFTVAHELGHLILGHTVSGGSVDFNSGCPEEIEANQFASELLVPLRLLKEAVYGHRTVSLLARAFWVSKDMMTWRVMKTNTYSLLEFWD